MSAALNKDNLIPESDKGEQSASRGPLHPLSIWERIKRDKLALTGAGIVFVFMLVAVFASYLAPESPFRRDSSRMNEPPRWLNVAHATDGTVPPRTTILGRDVAGRDLLSRVIYGTRTSLLLGLAVVTIAASIGVTLGALGGYAGGLLDSLIMRVVDVLLAFPFLILALAIISILPVVRPYHIALVLGVTSWPGICRLMRGQVLATRDLDFVNAARALGAGHLQIIMRHIVPNCFGPVIIWYSMGIAGAIMAEASLSFLIIGEQDSTSWGTMIAIGFSKAIFPEEWWPATFPAIALATLVLGFNLLGDGLQDAINPKMKK